MQEQKFYGAYSPLRFVFNRKNRFYIVLSLIIPAIILIAGPYSQIVRFMIALGSFMFLILIFSLQDIFTVYIKSNSIYIQTDLTVPSLNPAHNSYYYYSRGSFGVHFDKSNVKSAIRTSNVKGNRQETKFLTNPEDVIHIEFKEPLTFYSDHNKKLQRLYLSLCSSDKLMNILNSKN